MHPWIWNRWLACSAVPTFLFLVGCGFLHEIGLFLIGGLGEVIFNDVVIQGRVLGWWGGLQFAWFQSEWVSGYVCVNNNNGVDCRHRALAYHMGLAQSRDKGLPVRVRSLQISF